jgi:hypothetical protein
VTGRGALTVAVVLEVAGEHHGVGFHLPRSTAGNQDSVPQAGYEGEPGPPRPQRSKCAATIVGSSPIRSSHCAASQWPAM